MKNVTRFIGKKSWYDKSKNIVLPAAFCDAKNKKTREISVFDIDYELETNQEDKIYQIGDKQVFKLKPNTIARADLKVDAIEKIKSENDFLRVDKSFFSKHCNIRPFPYDDAKALHVASQLARISSLKLRQRNS